MLAERARRRDERHTGEWLRQDARGPGDPWLRQGDPVAAVVHAEVIENPNRVKYEREVAKAADPIPAEDEAVLAPLLKFVHDIARPEKPPWPEPDTDAWWAARFGQLARQEERRARKATRRIETRFTFNPELVADFRAAEAETSAFRRVLAEAGAR